MVPLLQTADARVVKERSAWQQVRRAEAEYATRLRAIARQVGLIVRTMLAPGQSPTPEVAREIQHALDRYAESLRPWAVASARRMLVDVERRDARAWARLARTMTRALQKEINGAPIGEPLRASLDRQVGLITSLPREAAQRVMNLALEGVATGRRAGEIRGYVPQEGLARDIYATGHVTISRANLIARTETSRVASELLQARARYVGSEGYIWRAVMDRDTRPQHRKLNGTFHKWDDPPVAEAAGQRHHPGEFPNCRCYPEPVIPETI